MIQYPDKPVRLIEAVCELPEGMRGCEDLFLDFESRSGDKKRPGDNPWGGDRICGAAMTWDDHPYSYYVPVRHNNSTANLPVEPFQRWLKDAVETCKCWSNHHVNFDAHFAAADGARFRGKLYDTLNNAKMVDSDRGFGGGGYGLGALSSDLLDEDIDTHDQVVQATLRGMKTKDYADCPADIMGLYAGMDPITARKLKAYQLKERDRLIALVPKFQIAWDMEQLLTPVLFDMEDRGIRVDPQELMMKQFTVQMELCELQEQLHELFGYPIDPSNTGDCYELICNQLGLPVLSWNDQKDPEKERTPCFDKDVLKSYLNYPVVAESERLTCGFHMMLKYRKRHTLQTLFINPFRELNVDGILHPQYTQLIRTGRMSSKRPNAQQNSKEAKELVHPRDGKGFLSSDGKQIEFRLIAHYSRDEEILEAYRRDPDTDFHMWVAEMCQITRDPAKTINFTIGYGGGKGKVVEGLANNMDLMKTLGMVVDDMVATGKISASQRRETFRALCQMRGESVYNDYHARLPGIKRVTRRAASLVKTTGMVFNEMGRIRRMPEKAAWRAFNSITQGLGSDIVKWGMITTSPRYCEFTRSRGIDLLINVHDELVYEGDKEAMRDPATRAFILKKLETLPVPLRVPIRFGMGYSDQTWRAASSKEGEFDLKPIRQLLLTEAA